MNKNPFDFTDTSDLPEGLAAKLTKSGSSGSTAFMAVVSVVQAAADAGINQLTLNQIAAAAHRMELNVPTEATVRNWLNKAVKQGYLSKPTRQTYALAGTVAQEPDDEQVPTTMSPTVEADDDPLADVI